MAAWCVAIFFAVSTLYGEYQVLRTVKQSSTILLCREHHVRDVFLHIPQCNSLSLLGVILQSNCKFSEHVRQKLVKANRCLHVLRSLRKERYSQVEINHLFKSLVLPNFTYCLAVFGASEPDLNIIQHFFDRCHKRRFVSFPVFIKNLLYRQDCKILKAITSVDNHPLRLISPPKKENKYNLRKKQCALSKVNTERFMTSYVNRLIFKHKMM